MFRQNEKNGRVWPHGPNLKRPLLHAPQRVLVINCDTDKEYISLRILHLSVNLQVFRAARVMNLKLNLTLVYILDALVNIEDGWLILVRKIIVQVVPY